MNLKNSFGVPKSQLFRFMRAVCGLFPGGKGSAFGSSEGKISKILVINLNRQPKRWRNLCRELGRFRTSNGSSLLSITKRFAAVDARDGRAVAATHDVDTNYKVGDQLFVQPDSKLAACFDEQEPVKMTRQEVAVARSHIEVWKSIAAGNDEYVLVLEDDVWFKHGAMRKITSAWNDAHRYFKGQNGPNLLYLSYDDTGVSNNRVDISECLFRPSRGLWFLSGYVLSKKGAEILLKAMPVVGPVDMWINYQLVKLNALALDTPIIMQRPDSGSDNSYSILPYLARAGTVDSNSHILPIGRLDTDPILVWTAGNENEGLAMALSMLGLRVRKYDINESEVYELDLDANLKTFDVLVDPPLNVTALEKVINATEIKFILEKEFPVISRINVEMLPPERTLVLSKETKQGEKWKKICTFLQLDEPVHEFPIGANLRSRVFRDDRLYFSKSKTVAFLDYETHMLDDSPWVLPTRNKWQPSKLNEDCTSDIGKLLVVESMVNQPSNFRPLVETFPGNLALFTKEGFVLENESANLVVSKTENGGRPYSSGAFASLEPFSYGRFEAEIKPASGSGLVTGFFLHRSNPRQEIDIEFAANDPTQLLANVYFNPGDEETEMSFGYRGAPCRIDLGFDATLEFHRYAIEWRPGKISWIVDDKIVHERVSWDPTPIPHLPMILYGNLWVPRSQELAGKMEDASLPRSASFKNITISTFAGMLFNT